MTPTAKNITVNSLPAPTITGNISICAGTTGVIYSTETGMTGYTWAVSSGGIITAGSGTNEIIVSWNTAGTQTVSINYNNAFGCAAGSPFVENVLVSSVPAYAGSISGPIVVNQGQSNVPYYTAPIENANGYNWTLPAGASITSGDNTNSIIVAFSQNASSGIIKVYGTNVCGSGIVSSDFNVTVNPLINAQLTLTNMIVGNGQSNCYNALQTINVAGNGTLYIVLGGGSATFIAGQNIRLLPGTSVMNGGYIHGYIATTGNYCGSMSPSLITMPIGTEEVSPQYPETSFFKVFPNPTSGKFNIEMKDIGSSDILIQIFGIMGEMVFHESGAGFIKKEISLENRPCGIYVILVKKDNKTGIQKIIRQ